MFSNTADAVFKRIAYCDRLMQLKENTSHRSVTNIAVINNQKKVLRSLIMGEVIDQSDKLLYSVDDAIQHIKNKIKDLESIKDNNELYNEVFGLKQFIRIQENLFGMNRALGMVRNEFNQLLQDLRNIVAEKKLDIKPLISNVVEGSPIKNMFDKDEYLRLHNQVGDISKRMKQLNGFYSSKLEGLYKEAQEKLNAIPEAMQLQKSIYFLARAIGVEDSDSERYAELKSQQDQLILERDALSGGVFDEYNAQKSEYSRKFDELQKERVRVIEKRGELAKKVKDHVFNSSNITRDQAKSWIDNQVTITGAVLNKMKRKGISKDAFYKSIEDFYILTNGRLGALTINTKNHNRAYATESSALVGKEVMLDNDFDLGTLWHEMAHHLESDPKLLEMAKSYIQSRSIDGGKIHQLRSLTGNKGFGASEKAYNTDMFNHYVAKVYMHTNATEVFSMGVEVFFSEDKLAKALQNDPETLDFVIGALFEKQSSEQKQSSDLLDKFYNLGSENKKLKQDSQKSELERVEQLLQEMESKVKYTVSNDTSWLYDVDLACMERDRVSFIGFVDLPTGTQYHVLKTPKVKEYFVRGRAKKGLIFIPSNKIKERIDHVKSMLKDMEPSNRKDYGVLYSFDRFMTYDALPILNQDVLQAAIIRLSGEVNLRRVVTDCAVGSDTLSLDSLSSLAEKLYKVGVAINV